MPLAPIRNFILVFMATVILGTIMILAIANDARAEANVMTQGRRPT